MAIMPGAIWRGPIPLTNYRPGRLAPIRGVTIHHMDTTLAVCDMLFTQPGYSRSAHFGTGRDGTIFQWVDTDDVAYHACNANWTGYIGIENDDQHADLPLSDEQIVAVRSIIDWLGIPKQLMTFETDYGVGYHGQFPGPCSSHWGQTACPGSMIDQLPLLIADIPPAPVPPKPKECHMYVLRQDPGGQPFVHTGGRLRKTLNDTEFDALKAAGVVDVGLWSAEEIAAEQAALAGQPVSGNSNLVTYTLNMTGTASPT